MEVFQSELQEGRIKEDAERIESTVQVCRPDADGMAEYSYDLGEEGSGSGPIFVNELFPEKKPGSMRVCNWSYSDGGIRSLKVDVVTLNEDGTVTFAVYRLKR